MKIETIMYTGGTIKIPELLFMSEKVLIIDTKIKELIEEMFFLIV